MPESKPDYEIKSFKNAEEFRKWLHNNHYKVPGIWIRMYKKASGIPSIAHQDAIPEALCYGWIDGQSKKYDEISWLQKFTPRGKRSLWSQINRRHIERLTKEGKMHPAGIAEVERAKADGRWDAAYAPPSEMKVPEDFVKALEKYPKALEFFNTLNKTNRFAISFRLATAVKPETRARRMEKLLEMMKKGEKIY